MVPLVGGGGGAGVGGTPPRWSLIVLKTPWGGGTATNANPRAQARGHSDLPDADELDGAAVFRGPVECPGPMGRDLLHNGGDALVLQTRVGAVLRTRREGRSLETGVQTPGAPRAASSPAHGTQRGSGGRGEGGCAPDPRGDSETLPLAHLKGQPHDGALVKPPDLCIWRRGRFDRRCLPSLGRVYRLRTIRRAPRLTHPRDALEGGGGSSPAPLQGAQPTPSHCPPHGRCRLQWHL